MSTVNEKLFIPSKIKVGFQHRSDTYTKKLAYVIYYDNKGVLRKEKSWKGWIHDKDRQGNRWDSEKREYYTVLEPGLPTPDYDNVPTEGFVLNKGVGGVRQSYGWNTRNEYVRVYDPRDFEFEISVANLLFILQECTSTKGKGLEGEFVYAWHGTQLVLLPVGCHEYKESTKHTKLQAKKVSAKEMVEGCVYKTKAGDKYTYIGRFNWAEQRYRYSRSDYSSRYELDTSKRYVFVDKRNNLHAVKSLTSFAEQVTETPVSNYAELVDIYHNSDHNADFKGLQIQNMEFDPKMIDTSYYYNRDQRWLGYKQVEPNVFKAYEIIAQMDYNNSHYHWNREYRITGFTVRARRLVSYKNGTFSIKDINEPGGNTVLSKQDIISMDFKQISVILHNDKTLKLTV